MSKPEQCATSRLEDLIKPLLFKKAVNKEGGGGQWEIWGKEEGGGDSTQRENVR